MAQDYLGYEAVRRRVEERLQRRRRLRNNLIFFLVAASGVLLASAGNLYIVLWMGMILFLWAIPLLFQGLAVYLDTDARRAAREQTVVARMESLYGESWRVVATPLDYDRTRLAVEQQVSRRARFVLHGVVFALTNGLLWLLLRLTFGYTRQFEGVLLAVGVIWGLSLIVQALRTFAFNPSRMSQHELTVQHEIEREIEQMNASEKAKRKRKHDEEALAPADDGELDDSLLSLNAADDDPERERGAST